MKDKPKGRKPTVLICVLFALAVWTLFGIGTIRSGYRIGYTGSDGWRSWRASYQQLNGTMRHSIYPKNTPETLHIEVTTEDGSISIQIKDKDKNIILDEKNIETSAFDLEISGRVTVQITADHHKGGFRIAAADPESGGPQTAAAVSKAQTR